MALVALLVSTSPIDPARAAAGRLDGFAGVKFGTSRADIERPKAGVITRNEPNRIEFHHMVAGAARRVFVYLPSGHATQIVLVFGSGRDRPEGQALFAKALSILAADYGPPDELAAGPEATDPPTTDGRTAYWSFEGGGELTLILRPEAAHTVSATFDPDVFKDLPPDR